MAIIPLEVAMQRARDVKAGRLIPPSILRQQQKKKKAKAITVSPPPLTAEEIKQRFFAGTLTVETAFQRLKDVANRGELPKEFNGDVKKAGLLPIIPQPFTGAPTNIWEAVKFGMGLSSPFTAGGFPVGVTKGFFDDARKSRELDFDVQRQIRDKLSLDEPVDRVAQQVSGLVTSVADKVPKPSDVSGFFGDISAGVKSLALPALLVFGGLIALNLTKRG